MLLRNAMGVGQKHYEGVRFNVSVTRGSQIPWKKGLKNTCMVPEAESSIYAELSR